MKRLVLIGSLLLTMSVFAKTLMIGSSPENPPFSNLDRPGGNFFGFDIDIMKAVCDRIKADCKFVPLEFDDEFVNLKDGHIDLAIAAIIITPERQARFLFSLPYLESNAGFMALQSSSINTPNDIESKTVGTRKGTPFKALAMALYDNHVNVIEYPYTPDLLDALRDKKVDAVFMDLEPSKYWYANNSTLYKMVGTAIPIGDGYGIMASKSQGDLIAQINQALLSMEADGSYLDIYTRYF